MWAQLPMEASEMHAYITSLQRACICAYNPEKVKPQTRL